MAHSSIRPFDAPHGRNHENPESFPAIHHSPGSNRSALIHRPLGPLPDFIGRPADGWGRDFLTLAVLILGAPYAAIAALIGVVLRRLSTTHVVGRGILWGVCAGVFLGISSCIGSTGLVTQ